MQIPVPATENMALSLCLSLNKAGVTPIHCELLYDDVQNERITSADELITPDDEWYPDELRTNSLDELIAQEEAAEREEALKQENEAAKSDEAEIQENAAKLQDAQRDDVVV